MKLNKQENYSHSYLLPFFQEVYSKKLTRAGLPVSTLSSDWRVDGYQDGPLTFVTMTHPNGTVFTGWAKFNASDSNYTKKGGIYRALQRAVDKYVEQVLHKQNSPYKYRTFNAAVSVI